MFTPFCPLSDKRTMNYFMEDINGCFVCIKCQNCEFPFTIMLSKLDFFNLKILNLFLPESV